MTQVLGYLQDAVALAFVVLGIAVAIGWLRRRDRSLAFLALAILLLSAVSGLGRLQAHVTSTIPLLSQLSLVAFMACAYALLLFRNSLIPLPRGWLVAATVAVAAASFLYFLLMVVTPNKTLLFGAAIVLILIWIATVGEPVVRFWLVAR
ncbi:MAG TPA: hypothetical protein VHQ03_06345, partial [Candidatus Dormibacteraeota bacterium]|nr:hypothetical protein [Candidatus Dormibacteraeota bacterium]